ncbi:MAG: hypothetical protein ACYTFD_16300, partial [Planctomycetota bacterium]
MQRKKLLVTVVSLAGLLAALLFLLRAGPSEVPTIEQVLPPADVAEIERVRRLFGSEPDIVLVARRRAQGPLAWERLQRVEDELRRVEGVTRTWSSLSRPLPVLAPDGALTVKAARAARAASTFLEPDPSTRV